jgi:hypothetical protein
MAGLVLVVVSPFICKLFSLSGINQEFGVKAGLSTKRGGEI